ncbi:MAG: hypothetical protein Q8Q06_01980 [bacterium]|nr:hypothetical protein [bacterium]
MILIAALFHDFDHSGRVGQDDLEIERAVRGLRANILGIDKYFQNDIEHLIRATEFPYKVPSSELTLEAQILRDADLSQALSVAWIQQVVFGLAEEMRKTPLEILKMQEGFLSNLKFSTDWAKQAFTQESIELKIEESRELLEILED